MAQEQPKIDYVSLELILSHVFGVTFVSKSSFATKCRVCYEDLKDTYVGRMPCCGVSLHRKCIMDCLTCDSRYVNCIGCSKIITSKN